jgi:DNA-binding transcriptional ArsR family regulator
MTNIQIDLNDPRTAKIAEVISNKTSKKIIIELTEKELSETELSKSLKLPSNTINYNVKKLEASGLIEKTGKFFWSVKGKRIHRYKLSNKKITISPKSLSKGIIPTILISSALALGIKLFIGNPHLRPTSTTESLQVADSAQGSTAIAVDESIKSVEPSTITDQLSSVLMSNEWAWFLLGSLVAILIFLLINSMKGGKNG